MLFHHFSTRGKSISSYFLIAMLGFTMIQPVMDAPSSNPMRGASTSSPSALETLSGAEMSAADINYYFDNDGIILVNDLEDPFALANTTGEASLLTRLFPEGEAGTKGAGAYVYLYRVDLSQVTSESQPEVCVTQMSLPFGTVAPFDYEGDGALEDYFVVNKNGALGSVTPSAVEQDTGTWEIYISFANTVCPGYGEIPGESSFFIGFAAYETYKAESAEIVLSPSGGHLSLDTRVPLAKGEGACSVIGSPGEIPSPSTINFDSLADETAILNAYKMSYGVSFNTGVKAETMTAPFKAKSEPNVAYAPFVAGVLTSIDVSFEQAVSQVGFYAGNLSAASVDVLVTGYQVLPGIPDMVVCQYRTTLPAAQMNTYIGFYDPQQRIRKVNVTYPGASTGEMIDDLQFAPGNGREQTEYPRPKTPLSGDGPKIVINRSDNTRFAATFKLPDPALWMEEQDDSDMRRLRFSMAGTEINANLPGYPDVPLMRRLIAIPEGSTPVLSGQAVVASDMLLADLYPAQPSAMDEDTDPPPWDPTDWVNPPYALDSAAYSTNAFFPAQPVSVYPLGKMRDLNLALVVVAGGQYNPVTRQLVIFKQVDLDVAFQGGLGTFLPDYSNNPFEPGIEKQYGSVLNTKILPGYLGPTIVGEQLGTELIIFTDPIFLNAANQLASWKIEKGISTSVVQTGGPNLDTPAEIKAYIKNKYDNSVVRPSYVLLMGDAEFIGSFPYYYYPPNLKSTSSDLDYVLMTDGDTFPDLAIGRIPVDTLNQALTVVNKIIAYESNPPLQPSFYNNIALASYFECCSYKAFNFAYDDRSFVETAEVARTTLIEDGKTVTRIYTTNTANPYKPTFYRNGASLPADLGYGSGFGWDGDTADIVDAFNTGTGLILHRDHGGPSGWSHPAFKTADLGSLTNGILTPVVYSVNCASGIWDNELPWETLLADTDVSWSEQILRMNGGAVSLIGDLRNSPTWANSALARGLFDATWKDTDPNLGSTITFYRLGDILNYARLYMFMQIFVPQTAGSVTNTDYEVDNHLYNVVGDPTLELWKEAPHRHLVSSVVYHWGGFIKISEKPSQEYPILTVEYPFEGAQITFLQNGEPVGRGTVVDGMAEISFIADFDPGQPLQVSACSEDDICTPLIPPYQFIHLPMIMK